MKKQNLMLAGVFAVLLFGEWVIEVVTLWIL